MEETLFLPGDCCTGAKIQTQTADIYFKPMLQTHGQCLNYRRQEGPAGFVFL